MMLLSRNLAPDGLQYLDESHP